MLLLCDHCALNFISISDGFLLPCRYDNSNYRVGIKVRICSLWKTAEAENTITSVEMVYVVRGIDTTPPESIAQL